jgi:hypothetical protein
MDLFLKIVAVGTIAALSFMGVYVTFYSPVTPQKKWRWLVGFAVAGVISGSATVWQSERSDAWLRQMITGGDNYAYLIADKGDLAARKNIIRLWVCATGDLYFLAIHPYPYGSKADDPAYVSIPGRRINYLGPGCGWAGIPINPGKFSVDLVARNRVVRETLEITAPAAGKFRQTCRVVGNDREPLPSPECS